MSDPFQFHPSKLESPATLHFAITASDSADLPTRPRSIYCDAAGTAVIRDEAGNDVTYNLLAGAVIPFRGVRVLATGTTATLIGWV